MFGIGLTTAAITISIVIKDQFGWRWIGVNGTGKKEKLYQKSSER